MSGLDFTLEVEFNIYFLCSFMWTSLCSKVFLPKIWSIFGRVKKKKRSAQHFSSTRWFGLLIRTFSVSIRKKDETVVCHGVAYQLS
jgi:hypothetical protein